MAVKEVKTRKDLVEKLANKGYTKAAANIIWQDVVAVLEETLVEGDSIRFIGFGTLMIRDIAERESAHPATGERIVIPAHKTVRFIPGKRLKTELANGFIRG